MERRDESELELGKFLWNEKQFFEVPVFLLFNKPMMLGRTINKGLASMAEKELAHEAGGLVLVHKQSPFHGSVLIELSGKKSADPLVRTFRDAIIYSKVHGRGKLSDSVEQLKNFVKTSEGMFPSELYFWNLPNRTVIFGKL